MQGPALVPGRPRLGVEVAGIRLRSFVANASGVLGWSREDAEKVERAGGGAFVAKTVTPEPRVGYPWPRLYPAGMGIVNAVGLANPGVDEAARLLREAVESSGIPVIASLAATEPREWVEAAAKLEEAGVAGLELNLSCPHFKGGGIELGSDPRAVGQVVSAVASTVRVPVIAKLGLSDRLVEAAAKALEAGARGLTLINSVRAMKIDVYAKRPVLGNVRGGLSGRAIHPIAVRAVYDVYAETQADIFGVGGVYTWEDAVELVLAGAKAVQVGSAIVERGPGVIREILEGVERYLWVEGVPSIGDLVGLAHKR